MSRIGKLIESKTTGLLSVGWRIRSDGCLGVGVSSRAARRRIN